MSVGKGQRNNPTNKSNSPGLQGFDLTKHLFNQGGTGPHPLHDRISHAIAGGIDGNTHGTIALLQLCTLYVCVVLPGCCQHG